MNKQRENIYSLRRELLEGQVRLEEDAEPVDTRKYLMTLAEDLIAGLVEDNTSKDQDPSEWDLGAVERAVVDVFGIDAEAVAAVNLPELSPDEMIDRLTAVVVEQYEEKEKSIGVDPAILRRVERDIMLQIVDAQWKDHLYSLDHLKEGISLRGYGQRDPLVEYKKESFQLFKDMKARIDEEMVRYLWRLRPAPASEEAPPAIRQPERKATPLTFSGGSSGSPAPASSRAAAPAMAGAMAGGAPRPARTGGDDAPVTQVRRDEPKIGRNDPCWCGSGKKFKKCHGA
jgi:preprotein translocase subunit SecA